MVYSLWRAGGIGGDSGPMCQFFKYSLNENDQVEIEYIQSEIPVVGYCVRVGSLFARSYSGQDWWQTTEVQEILEDEMREDEQGEYRYVKFRTHNSIYEWTDR
jgi:hypothetical protein